MESHAPTPKSGVPYKFVCAKCYTVVVREMTTAERSASCPVCALCGYELEEIEIDTPDAEVIHVLLLSDACSNARAALASAVRHGRRTDCLRDAVRSLEGALDNVRYEDALAHKARRSGA